MLPKQEYNVFYNNVPVKLKADIDDLTEITNRSKSIIRNTLTEERKIAFINGFRIERLDREVKNLNNTVNK